MKPIPGTITDPVSTRALFAPEELTLVQFWYDGVWRLAQLVSADPSGDHAVRGVELIRGDIVHPAPRPKSYRPERIERFRFVRRIAR